MDNSRSYIVNYSNIIHVPPSRVKSALSFSASLKFIRPPVEKLLNEVHFTVDSLAVYAIPVLPDILIVATHLT